MKYLIIELIFYLAGSLQSGDLLRNHIIAKLHTNLLTLNDSFT